MLGAEGVWCNSIRPMQKDTYEEKKYFFFIKKSTKYILLHLIIKISKCMKQHRYLLMINMAENEFVAGRYGGICVSAS